MADDTGPQAERLLLKANHIYRWRGRRMGRTTLRAHVGLLLLTTRRLVFLSSGRTDAWSAMAWASLGLGPQPVVAAATATDVARTVFGWIHDRFAGPAVGEAVRVQPARLLQDGSLSVPLGALTQFGVTRRRFASFLWIAYQSPDLPGPQEFTFSGKVAIPGGAIWASTISQTRENLLRDGER